MWGSEKDPNPDPDSDMIILGLDPTNLKCSRVDWDHHICGKLFIAWSTVQLTSKDTNASNVFLG